MNGNIALDFGAVAFVNDSTAYASACEFNGLFRINFKNNRCEYICLFQGEAIDGKRIHCRAKYVNRKIYFFPSSGKFISVYDIEKNAVYEIPIPTVKQNSFYRPIYKFIDAVVIENHIWIVPSTYPGIIKLDTQTDRVEIIDQWVPREGFFFRNGLCIENEKFYVPSGDNNVVLEFDTNQGKGHVHYVGSHNNGCMSMCKFGEEFWLAPRVSGPIIRWNIQNGYITEYNQYPDNFIPRKIVFLLNYCIDDVIYFIPAYANMAVEMSVTNQEMKESTFVEISNESHVEYLFETDTEYYLRVVSDREIKRVKISKIDHKMEKCSFYYEIGLRRHKAEYFEKLRKENVVIKENLVCCLSNFIKDLSLDSYDVAKESKLNTVGEIFWNEIHGGAL